MIRFQASPLYPLTLMLRLNVRDNDRWKSSR
jgi:hypothetical protein